MAVESLQITVLTRDETMQPRKDINKSVVLEYAEDFKSGAKPHPIGVIYDGEHYWVWDGFHRIAAFEELGRNCIDAEVEKGTRRDALKKSLSANSTHGQRRTNEDKRRAVQRALSDAEWAKFSDRIVADMCAVDSKTVGSVRQQLESTAEVPQLKSTVGKDGKTRKRPKPKRTPVKDLMGGDKEEKKSEPPKDETGVELYPCLHVTFTRAAEFDEATKLINYVLRLVADIAGGPHGEQLKAGQQRIESDLRKAKTAIREYRPYAGCRKCKGHGCASCGNLGWLVKGQWQNTPEGKK